LLLRNSTDARQGADESCSAAQSASTNYGTPQRKFNLNAEIFATISFVAVQFQRPFAVSTFTESS